LAGPMFPGAVPADDPLPPQEEATSKPQSKIVRSIL